MWFVPNTVIGAEGTAHPQENSAIYASFKLENSISRQKLYNYKHFFFLKTGNFAISLVSLSLLQANRA